MHHAEKLLLFIWAPVLVYSYPWSTRRCHSPHSQRQSLLPDSSNSLIDLNDPAFLDEITLIAANSQANKGTRYPSSNDNAAACASTIGSSHTREERASFAYFFLSCLPDFLSLEHINLDLSLRNKKMW